MIKIIAPAPYLDSFVMIKNVATGTLVQDQKQKDDKLEIYCTWDYDIFGE
jgi:hypothetical protein